MSTPPKPQAVASVNRPAASPLTPAATIAPASAWAAPVVQPAAAGASPAAPTSGCDTSLALHPISCLISTTPVQLELALTFSTTCTGTAPGHGPMARLGVTYFVLQNITPGPTGINATFEVTPDHTVTQVFYINLNESGYVPPTLTVNGVVAYPDGTQERKAFVINTPQNKCCFKP